MQKHEHADGPTAFVGGRIADGDELTASFSADQPIAGCVGGQIVVGTGKV
jgi:hypothetical protein